ncbi:MAG: MBL fold metallo-hydrolase [Candidatus Moranbacteria bacterium]|nr:MBL fold metallo-hydrolase [Candidatus Moranbacteria bacterium]
MKKLLLFHLFLTAFVLILELGLKKDLQNDKFEVVYLDVGQGDSSLITIPGTSIQILVDAGDGRSVVLEEKLKEYLPKGDDLIDILILTHPHDDHYGGMEYVLNNFRVGLFMYNAIYSEDEVYNNLIFKIQESETAVLKIIRGQKIKIGDDFSIQILHPFYSFDLEYKNLNNSSVVFLAEYKQEKFLFAGDLEKEGELLVLDYLKRRDKLSGIGRVKVLKVGHHGSNTATGELWLKTLKPEKAIISAGVENRFRHPHKEVIERLRAYEVEIFQTKERGNIEISHFD